MCLEVLVVLEFFPSGKISLCKTSTAALKSASPALPKAGHVQCGRCHQSPAERGFHRSGLGYAADCPESSTSEVPIGLFSTVRDVSFFHVWYMVIELQIFITPNVLATWS